MGNYVALLRAVNVAGKNKLKMNELKLAMQNAGFTNVKTYIQSGNIVFSSDIQSEACVAEEITKTIQNSFQLTLDVFVYKEDSYKEIIQNNPFPPEKMDKDERLIAIFYKENINIPRQKNEQAEVIGIGRVLYIHVFADQIHTLKLAVFLGEYKKTISTTRNWRTTQHLQTFLQALNIPE